MRVDLYTDGQEIRFGEMTFWPMAGRYQGCNQLELGEFLDFRLDTYKIFRGAANNFS